MSEGDYLDTLCNTADGVFITDGNSRIIRWNRGAERILGYPEIEVINRDCFQVIAGKSLSNQAICGQSCKIHASGVQGSPQENFDLQTQTSEGKPVWLNITILSNADHEKPFIAHILRDVTKEKRTMLALEQFLADLEASGTASAAFPAGIQTKRSSGNRNPATEPAQIELSDREIEVLTLLAEGLSTKGLAQKLNISHFTARNHIQNILVKLNLHSKAQAVSYAFKKGIL